MSSIVRVLGERQIGSTSRKLHDSSLFSNASKSVRRRVGLKWLHEEQPKIILVGLELGISRLLLRASLWLNTGDSIPLLRRGSALPWGVHVDIETYFWKHFRSLPRKGSQHNFKAKTTSSSTKKIHNHIISILPNANRNTKQKISFRLPTKPNSCWTINKFCPFVEHKNCM